MLRVAIIGASGFTGVELLRLLALHPGVEIVAVTSRQYEGKSVTEVFPSLKAYPYSNLYFSAPDTKKLSNLAGAFFTAVPHAAAMKVVPELLNAGAKVIDLSADFRLRDVNVYNEWYAPHLCPEFLDEAVYGLCEINREKIASSRLVANPGCYPTSTLLPLIPLLKSGIVDTKSTLVIDSKSGVSGAGRKALLATSFCEVNESFKAYKVGEHRHTPEIEQELSIAASEEIKVCFTPHLVPMTRGILTTIYAKPTKIISTTDVIKILDDSYSTERFVKILEEGQLPSINMIKGSNLCVIGVKVDKRTNTIILVSAIDNLVKGASGQAIQNLNIMFGFDEYLGLDVIPLYP